MYYYAIRELKGYRKIQAACQLTNKVAFLYALSFPFGCVRLRRVGVGGPECPQASKFEL